MDAVKDLKSQNTFALLGQKMIHATCFDSILNLLNLDCCLGIFFNKRYTYVQCFDTY